MKFIGDRSITLNEDTDILKTSVYTDTLVDIINSKNDDSNFTIGLFGKSGSGKSSILKTLEERIKEDNKLKKDLKVFKYDALRYTGEDFKKSFIKEIKNQFDLESEEQLENYFKDDDEKIEHKVGVKNKKIIDLMVFLPLIFIIMALIPDVNIYLKILSIILGPLLSYFAYMIKDSLVQYKVKITKAKDFNTEELYEIMDEAISKTTKNNTVQKWFKSDVMLRDYNPKKVIMIIENIDKCPKERVIEIISALRSPLNHKYLNTIIPIDESIIIKTLTGSYEDIEEIIRGIFNTIIRIKSYSNKDLFTYTNELIQKEGLEFSTIIADMVSQEFSKNPRRIIHFLNNLSSEKILIEKLEQKDMIKNVSSNMEFVAKIQIIKEEWPELFEKITQEPELLKYIDESIKNNGFKKYFKDGELIYESKKIILNSQQYLFFSRTRTVQSENVLQYLIIQDHDADIPENVIESLESGNWDELKNQMKNGKIKPTRLMEIIYEELDKDINKKDYLKTKGFVILNILFNFIYEKEYQEIFIRIHKMMEVFIDKKILDNNLIDKFDTEPMMNYSYLLTLQEQYYLRDYIAEHINQNFDPEKKDTLLETYIKYYKDDENSLEKIKDSFSKKIKNNLSAIEEFEEVINNKHVIKYLINEDFILDTISRLEKDYQENENKKRIILLDYVFESNAMEEKTQEIYIEKINQFLNDYTDENLQYWLEKVQKIVEKSQYSENIKLFDIKLNEIYTYLIQEIKNIDQKRILTLKIYITTLEEYIKQTSLSEKSEFIFEILNKTENEEIIKIACNTLYELKDIRTYNEKNGEILTEKFLEINDMIIKQDISQNLIYDISKKEVDIKTIEKFIDAVYDLLFDVDVSEAEIPLEIATQLSEIQKIENLIYNRVRNELEIKIKNRIMWIAQKTQKIWLKDRLISEMIKNTEDGEKLKKVIKDIEENVSSSEEIIEKNIINMFNIFTYEHNPEYHKSLIEICSEKMYLFNENDFAIISDELKYHLISKDLINKRFAIINIEKIYDKLPKKKYKSIKSILSDEEFEFKEDNDKEKLENLKKKFGIK
ncbi:KAP-like P-loop domain-containing protein [Oceanotoga teriensis]|uniref:KAP-like P-loop domain-containing protein n=1 Tax=Oceanotoga teriensis TaxID=515440 RepID=A0AA45C5K4_9BACT|nr:P-loop NTPase fold protein [Oceanotoga teriensis]PWJ89045.1 KAP-like P-loop domain-containing protein [Oceanotoga teriensis]